MEEEIQKRTWWRSRAFKLGLALVAIVAGVAVAIPLWRYLSSYVSTDDAQVEGLMVPIDSRIQGTIIRVMVHNTEAVKRGQELVELDPREYLIAIAQAQAMFSEAQAQFQAGAANIKTAAAKIIQDQANYAKAASDVPRLKALAEHGAAPRENYLESLRQQRVYEAGTAADQAALNSARKDLEYRRARVAVAKAALDQAMLNFTYTKIDSPVSGVVGDRTAQLGERVAPGQGLMAVTSLDDLWVTANFKETAFGALRPGLPATIHVDAVGRDLKGYVEGLGGATGSLYSLLPPENATGNWIKVVQRLPVRVRFDQNDDPPPQLRPGQSAEVTVWLP